MCEKVFDNETKLKQHKKIEHTHHIVKFQCNECNFLASEPHTLQVHFGKHHSTQKHCGLCDKEFINLEEHKKNSPAHYSFSYCTMNAKDNSENEIYKQYFTIYHKDW